MANLSDDEIKIKIEGTKSTTNELKSVFEEKIVLGVDRNLKSTYIPARKEYERLNTEVISIYNQMIESFNKDKESANTNVYRILKETSVIVIIWRVSI